MCSDHMRILNELTEELVRVNSDKFKKMCDL